MLSSSASAYGYDLHLGAFKDPTVPMGIPGGTELLRLVDAAIVSDPIEISVAHAGLLDSLGPESIVDAAAVFGNFEMMNRVAEGSGIPVSAQAIERMRSTIDELGLERFLKS